MNIDTSFVDRDSLRAEIIILNARGVHPQTKALDFLALVSS